MISESQQDQAALYALGLLDDSEWVDFERALAVDAELRALVGELRESAAALALAAGPETLQPSAELKARVLARVGWETAPALPRRGNTRNPWTTWVPWAIAAAAAAISILTSLDRNRWYWEAARARGNTVRALASRKQAIPLPSLAVCQLDPTPDASGRARAVVVWDPANRQGEILVTQLTPPTEGHDYQLWAVEEGRKDAVSAGLVHVAGDGSVRSAFSPSDPNGGKVQAFALSLERAGGSETNQGPILLLGKL